MNWTVLGRDGLIGGALVRHLHTHGQDVFAPSRIELGDNLSKLKGRPLGNLIYAIGLTADFRERLFDTVDAHVSLLTHLIRDGDFSSLTYLSSTRVYAGADSTKEDTVLQASPAKRDSIYNLSKLLGESICLHTSHVARVVRISNVYSANNESHSFLSSVLRQAALTRHVTFTTSHQSTKDFVSVSDLCKWIPAIAAEGESGVYNLASGVNTSNAEIAAWLRRRGTEVEFAFNAPTWSFPTIDISKVTKLFGPACNCLRDDFDSLFETFCSTATR